MKLSLIALASIAFTLSACTSSEKQRDDIAPESIGTANEAFDELAVSFPALNAVVLKDGEMIWSRQGGVRRDDTDGLDRDYNFYSIAKMITGTAFYQLEQAGRVDLDAPITDLDPALDPQFGAVTLRHLLGHTSGIRHYSGETDWRAFNERRCAAPADAMGHFIDDPLQGAPGDAFGYSTFGFVLLSHLLMQTTGEESYDAAMRSTLGDAYRFQTDRDGANKAVNYLQTDGSLEAISLSAECKFGGGGLLGSAHDLAHFGDAMVDGLVDPADLSAWTLNDGTEAPIVYGMASQVSEELQSRYATHSGGSPGGRGFLFVLFEQKIVVALTANSDGPNHGDTAIAIGSAFALPAPNED